MKEIPFGIEDFNKLRKKNCYYVDKTSLIADLLDNVWEVTLFTRPRRFGKTLTMSMLKYFLEIGSDPSLFDGLEIISHGDICEEHMGKHPVVFLTFKEVAGNTYEDAMRALADVLEEEIARIEDKWHISESDLLNETEKAKFAHLQKIVSNFSAAEGSPTRERNHYNSVDFTATIKNSLKTLTRVLKKHCGREVVLLVDEYDVPLDKANQCGYYAKMVDIIRSMFSSSMKSNTSLEFAVLTGCLRVSKESIFTGLNNPEIHTITDAEFSSAFGFTDTETEELMAYYGLGDRMADAKEWYNGYQFKNSRVYNPWDILSFAKKARTDPNVEPAAYWMNSSGNEIIRQLADMSSSEERDEIALLIDGGTIKKQVNQQLTYSDLYASSEHVWSVMFMAGYLTARESLGDDVYMLAIPNKSVQRVFSQQLTKWFRDRTEGNREAIEKLGNALMAGSVKPATEALDTMLMDVVGIRDYSVKDDSKENFYHGFLLGALKGFGGLEISSNQESGLGYYDITVRFGPTGEREAFIIEVKYAKDQSKLEDECGQAINQIIGKQYAQKLRSENVVKITAYGAAFHRKRCMIVSRPL